MKISTRFALAVCTIASVSTISLEAATKPWPSIQDWPAQPYNPPHLTSDIRWPGDIDASRPSKGFCAGSAIDYQRPAVRVGGLLGVRSNALFFQTPKDLALFEGPAHAIGERVRFLPPNHPLTALEDIPERSAGGRVRDELFGWGFVRWERDSDEKFPDWRELYHANDSRPCGVHDFVHYPPKIGHRQFGRPAWPRVRYDHEKARIPPVSSIGRLRIEKHF